MVREPERGVSIGVAAPAAGGEMLRCIEAHDWSAGPLGPLAGWPAPLRDAVRRCLAAPDPAILFWGPDLLQFYNDAVRALLGRAHPAALGQPARLTWAAAWGTLGPLVEGVRTADTCMVCPDLDVSAAHSDDAGDAGDAQERHLSGTLAPVHDEQGGVAGVQLAGRETTALVVGERRMRLLRALAERLPEAGTVEEVAERACAALAEAPDDVPFALLYLIGEGGTRARLAAASGLAAGSAQAPLEVPCGRGAPRRQEPWPLARVVRTGRAEPREGLALRVGAASVREALLVPLAQPGQAALNGILVLGVSRRHRLDEDERGFFELIAGQVAAALAARQGAREGRGGEFLAVLNAITDAIYVYDANGHLIQTNAAAHTLNPGTTQRAYLDQPFGERFAHFAPRTPDGAPIPTDELPVARVLRGETLTGNATEDTLMRAINGQDIIVNTSGAPVRDAAGRIVGGVIVTRDVTLQRQLTRRTREALDALLAIAETLVAGEEKGQPAEGELPGGHGGMQRLGELTRKVLGCERVSVTSIDPRTARQVPVAAAGLSDEQARRWREEQLAAPPLTPTDSPMPDVTARLLAGEAVILDMTEPHLRDAPNPYGILQVLVVPMHIGEHLVGLLSLDYGGAPHTYLSDELTLATGVAHLAALVIERERLLAEREEARSNALALREANRRMDHFLGMASHEIKTPLTTIVMNIALAERRLARLTPAPAEPERAEPERAEPERAERAQPVIGDVRDLLRRSQEQAARLNRLVDDLLDTSRIQTNRLEMRPVTCDLVEIAGEVVSDARVLHPGRVLALDAPDPGTLPLLADRDRIAQVVANYLSNALKYSPADRPVRVRLRRQDGEARLEVCDEGPGLPEAAREHVWERFYRVEGIRAQAGAGVGLGLGLHISRTIIEHHGGQVGVEDAAGEGCAFWFTLPLADGTDAASERAGAD